LNINRAQLIDELRKMNIGVGVHFMPVHQHIYYNQTFNLDNKDFPVASAVFPRLISLPIYPGMKDEHVDRLSTY
jgi:perosamine synthetase